MMTQSVTTFPLTPSLIERKKEGVPSYQVKESTEKSKGKKTTFLEKVTKKQQLTAMTREIR